MKFANKNNKLTCITPITPNIESMREEQGREKCISLPYKVRELAVIWVMRVRMLKLLTISKTLAGNKG